MTYWFSSNEQRTISLANKWLYSEHTLLNHKQPGATKKPGVEGQMHIGFWVFSLILSTHSLFCLMLVLPNRRVVTGTEGGTKIEKSLYVQFFFSASGKLIIFKQCTPQACFQNSTVIDSEQYWAWMLKAGVCGGRLVPKNDLSSEVWRCCTPFYGQTVYLLCPFAWGYYQIWNAQGHSWAYECGLSVLE